MTDTDTITVPGAVPTDSTGLAAAIEAAGADGTAEDLWRRLTEQEGFSDGLDMWAAALRENDSRGRADAFVPGDRSPEGLALAQLQFVREARLEDGDLLRGEVRAGVATWDGDLTFHVSTYARAEAIGAKLGLAEEDRPIVVRDVGARRLRTFRGKWQEYDVAVFAIADQSGTEVQP